MAKTKIDIGGNVAGDVGHNIIKTKVHMYRNGFITGCLASFGAEIIVGIIVQIFYDGGIKGFIAQILP